MHAITKSQSYQLRIDLEDWDGNTAYAIYKYDCSILILNSNKVLNLIANSKIAATKLATV